MSKWFDRIATIVIVLAALSVASVTTWRLLARAPSNALVAGRQIDDWRSLASAGQIIGNPDAPSKIVEFADFECPYCARAHLILKAILKDYPTDVAIVYRHYPLESIHLNAYEAAVGAVCAGEQGRFSAYHNLLFEQPGLIKTGEAILWAREADVPNLGAYEMCLSSDHAADVVRRDVAVAEEMAIPGTPTLIVNGVLVSGVPTRADLESLLFADPR